GTGLLLRDEVANALHEDLTAAAGDRVQAGCHQLANHVARVHAKRLGEEIDLAWGEAVDVDGMVRLDVPEQVEIPLEWDVWVVAALHQDLDGVDRLGLIDLLADVLVGESPSLGVLRPAVECAETAVGDADIRDIDVAVDDVRDRVVRMLLHAHAIRLGTDLEERCVRVEIEEIVHTKPPKKRESHRA